MRRPLVLALLLAGCTGGSAPTGTSDMADPAATDMAGVGGDFHLYQRPGLAI